MSSRPAAWGYMAGLPVGACLKSCVYNDGEIERLWSKSGGRCKPFETAGQSMKSISWLHMTDHHLGMAGQAHLWPNIREAFYNDLAELHEATGPWAAVFFTGDLVQGGRAEEFRRIGTWLEELWAEFKSLGSSPALFTVPGNHDLARPNPKLSAVRLLVKWSDNQEIHEEFWADPDSEYRQIITGSLSNYSDWWSSSPLICRQNLSTGVLPGDFTATLEIRGLRIGVAGLNTTFLQRRAGHRLDPSAPSGST